MGINPDKSVAEAHFSMLLGSKDEREAVSGIRTAGVVRQFGRGVLVNVVATTDGANARSLSVERIPGDTVSADLEAAPPAELKLLANQLRACQVVVDL